MKLINYKIGKLLILSLFTGLVGCGGHSITIGDPSPGSTPTPTPESKWIQDIRYEGGGKITQYRTNDVISQGNTRICLINSTGQPKMMKWIRVLPQGRVNHMSAPNNGEKSCVTIPSNQRIEFTFRDRDKSVRKDAMTLNNWGGILVTFNWVKDNNNFERAGGVSCGAKNQRPCKVWERIPSCNSNLYEDFGSNRCRAKQQKVLNCGAKNQRPCKVWERIPSCNGNLYEDFGSNRCRVKAKPKSRPRLSCGAKHQRPCKLWERIPSCNSGLREYIFEGRCR